MAGVAGRGPPEPDRGFGKERHDDRRGLGQAHLAAPVLVAAAGQRRVLTYELVAAKVGTEPTALGSKLRFIMRHGLPPLTVLVVNRHTGVPGRGLVTVKDRGRDREQVFRLNWYQLDPPTAEELAEALARLEAG